MLLKNKKANIIVLFMLLSMTFSLCCFFGYTIPKLMDYRDKHKFDIQIKHDPLGINDYDFDYFSGIYLNGSILFLVLLLILFDAPSFKDIYKFFIKNLKNKIKEKKKI